ncbi:MAG: exodeoxyribonuclease VII small subunit [Chloroflexota bacterium]
MSKGRSPGSMSFEQAFQELETTVKQLESGELPLEQAMTLFERGQALAARCSALLDQAELRLKQLAPDDAGGYTESEMSLDEED